MEPDVLANEIHVVLPGIIPAPVVRIGERCFELVGKAGSSSEAAFLVPEASINELFDDCPTCGECSSLGCAGTYRTDTISSTFFGQTVEDVSSEMLTALSSLYTQIRNPGYGETRAAPYNDMTEGPCANNVVECAHSFKYTVVGGFSYDLAEIFGCYSCKDVCGVLCVNGSKWSDGTSLMGDINGNYSLRYDVGLGADVWTRYDGQYFIWYDKAHQKWELIETASYIRVFLSKAPLDICPPNDIDSWETDPWLPDPIAIPPFIDIGTCDICQDVSVTGSPPGGVDIDGVYSWGFTLVNEFGWSRSDGMYFIYWEASSLRWLVVDASKVVIYYTINRLNDFCPPTNANTSWLPAGSPPP